jgi:hypothetical protein
MCPLCGSRRARRGCPAVGQQICAICCGTKRLVEIQCPSDCPYLASAREHPAATVVRQQQRDFGMVMHVLRDFNKPQSQLFLLIASFLNQYKPLELQTVIDDDVVEAATALAATFETASKGVIYEHRPTSLSAQRLMSELKPLLAEAGKGRGSTFERDAAVVLRRVEDAARAARTADAENRRALLDTLGRVFRDAPEQPPAATAAGPSLIVP